MIQSPPSWNVSGDLLIWRSSLIPVSEWLDSALGLPFILWYFSGRKPEKRLTLAQNPQFYDEFPTTYGPASQIWPAEIPDKYHDTFYVLTNNERRVVLEFGESWRSFDNIWRTNDNTLILKGSSCLPSFFLLTNIIPDVIGNIEGEAIVEKSFRAGPLALPRPCKKHPDFELKEVVDKTAWKTPIHNLLDSQRTHMHIWIDGQ